jgi:hypothetical protein
MMNKIVMELWKMVLQVVEVVDVAHQAQVMRLMMRTAIMLVVVVVVVSEWRLRLTWLEPQHWIHRAWRQVQSWSPHLHRQQLVLVAVKVVSPRRVVALAMVLVVVVSGSVVGNLVCVQLPRIPLVASEV